MKKRLEAELISIAHRILKLKNKAELNQLYQESQKLYETLSVLKFYEDNFNTLKNDVPAQILEEKIESSYTTEEEPVILETQEEVQIPVETIEEKTIEETIVENKIEETKAEETLQTIEEKPIEEEPVVENTVEEIETEEETAEAEETQIPTIETPQPKAEEHIKPRQISIEELLGNYTEPEFVKPEPKQENPKPVEETPAPPSIEPETKQEPQTTPQSQRTDLGITIGLNDRVGFVNYLFNGSNEDFNRVISQLNTCHTFTEAQEFITHMVKPDYNNWKGLEDYEERFLETIKTRF